MKVEIWPSVRWRPIPTILIMDVSKDLPRSWFVSHKIELDWAPGMWQTSGS